MPSSRRTTRKASHVVIDSHPVTKERFGYRVTAYSLERFAQLRPTQIWMIYISPEVAIERIAADARGRPTITVEEARFHTHLQASVALAYGIAADVPVHLFDSDRPPDELDRELAARF